MSKAKIIFRCSNCESPSVRWEGRCPVCKEWNTMVEVTEQKSSSKRNNQTNVAIPIALQDIVSSATPRLSIPHDSELNRVLGGGIVPGSLILIGGQPGIGKSTLMLQLATQLNKEVLYVSGEESAQQIKMRADRISSKTGQCRIYCETQLDRITTEIKQSKPELILIDSIQTLARQQVDSLAGSITQIRECTSELHQIAKSMNIPIIIIGHITKEGSLAGPKVLEHIVDVVLQFEGDRNYIYRILRTIKNRFGSTDEIGIYEMNQSGLRAVSNPSELLISPSEEQLSGASIACTIEGIRPLLIETQALVSTTVYGHPQRSATGFDTRRLSMLLAVLEKKCGLFFSQHDVFLNLAGGIKISDPAIDLSIMTSLISSLNDIPVGRKICFAGEVGLTGEIRAVNRIEQRILEAERLGFEQIFISRFHSKRLPSKGNIDVQAIGKVQELLPLLFS